MSITDTRVRPCASLKVYQPGSGFGLWSDRGWGWYDILETSGYYGTTSFDGEGDPHLMIVPGIGLACKPRVIKKDSRLSQFTYEGGTWVERRASVGSPRFYRICQISNAANAVWRATSTASLPDNPCFAFSVYLGATPADHSDSGAEPVVYVRFGAGHWAIQFGGGNGITLYHYESGAWRAVKQIVGYRRQPYQDTDETFVKVWCLAGKILVNVNEGDSWTTYENKDGTDIQVSSGPIVFEGVSRVAAFAVHQVKFEEGTYHSVVNRTNMPRPTATAVINARQYHYGGLTSVTATEVDTSEPDKAQYKLVLTPATTSGFFWPTYHSPAVKSVTFRYEPVQTPGGTDSTTPFDDYIIRAVIDKPAELHGGTATVTCRMPNMIINLETFSWRWRPVHLLLGDHDEDGTVTWRDEFVGFVREINFRLISELEVEFTIKIDNGAAPAKWQLYLHPTPWGGYTVNQALGKLLDLVGIDATKRHLHESGNDVTLPLGDHKNPSFFPKPGDTYWEAIVEISKHAGLEVWIGDNGDWWWVPFGYEGPLVGEWNVDNPADVWQVVRDVEEHYNSANIFSGIILRAKDARGWPIQAQVFCEEDLTNTASDRFTPWMDVHIEDLSGSHTAESLQTHLDNIYDEYIPKRIEMTLTGEARGDIKRRDTLKVTAAGLNLAEGANFIVTTMKVEYAQDWDEVKTTVGLRRV